MLLPLTYRSTPMGMFTLTQHQLTHTPLFAVALFRVGLAGVERAAEVLDALVRAGQQCMVWVPVRGAFEHGVQEQLVAGHALDGHHEEILEGQGAEVRVCVPLGRDEGP